MEALLKAKFHSARRCKFKISLYNGQGPETSGFNHGTLRLFYDQRMLSYCLISAIP